MSTGKGTRGRSRGKDAVRCFNKHVLNPAMLRLAGRRHWYAAALRHLGRRSGRAYVTPVVASRTSDGFIVPLPYGTQVDWLRNVLAAGHATIETKGDSYEVVEPEVVGTATAFPRLPSARRYAWRLFGIKRYLRVKIQAEPRP